MENVQLAEQRVYWSVPVPVFQATRPTRRSGIRSQTERVRAVRRAPSLFGAPGERTFYRVKVPKPPGSGKA